MFKLCMRPSLQRIDDQSFYSTMESAIGASRPSALYDNSPIVTKILFTVIKALPRRIADKARLKLMLLPEFRGWNFSCRKKKKCFQELSAAAVENALKVSKTVLGAIQYNDKRAARLRGFCKFLAWRKIRQFQPRGSWKKIQQMLQFLSIPELVSVRF